MKTITGILEFKTGFHWAKNVLDKCFETEIASIPCKIQFPRLDSLWFDKKKEDLDYLHMPLKSPTGTGTWYIGDEEKIWGYPISYPSGISHLSDLFITFEIDENMDINIISNKIYENINSWKIVFYKYLKILSKQLRYEHNDIENSRPLTLFNNKNRIKYNKACTLYGIIPEESNCITYETVSNALYLTKNKFDISLHYELLLSAYTELEKGNYRKAVIAAATSLETLLTQRILTEFLNQNITFGDKLLKKYTMIKGKFELLNVLNVSVPTTDYPSKILEPRNKAIHGGNPLDRQTANTVISEVEKYLNAFDKLI